MSSTEKYRGGVEVEKRARQSKGRAGLGGYQTLGARRDRGKNKGKEERRRREEKRAGCDSYIGR